MRAIQLIILVLTFVGVGLRAANISWESHVDHQECCEHQHEHDHHEDEKHQTCKHHHCHCPLLPPLFCLIEFPKVIRNTFLAFGSLRIERKQWRLPEDPYYAPEIPPIIS